MAMDEKRLVSRMVLEMKAQRAEIETEMAEYAVRLRDAAKNIERLAEQVDNGIFDPTGLEDATRWAVRQVESLSKQKIALDTLRWVEIYYQEQEDLKGE